MKLISSYKILTKPTVLTYTFVKLSLDIYIYLLLSTIPYKGDDLNEFGIRLIIDGVSGEEFDGLNNCFIRVVDFDVGIYSSNLGLVWNITKIKNLSMH